MSHVGVDADPAVELRQLAARAASAMGARTRTWPSMVGRRAVRRGEPHAAGGRATAPRGACPRRAGRTAGVVSGGGVEVRRAGALEAADQDAPGLDAHASVDRAERVVVGDGGDLRRQAAARTVHLGASDAHRDLECRPGDGVILRGHVDVHRPRPQAHAVDRQLRRSVGHRERGEGCVERPARPRRLPAAWMFVTLPSRTSARTRGSSSSTWHRWRPSPPAARRVLGRTRTRSHSTAGEPPSVASTRTCVSSTARGQTRSATSKRRRDALLSRGQLRLLRRPPPREGRSNDERAPERQEAYDREHHAKRPRDLLPPVPPPTAATAARGREIRLPPVHRLRGRRVGRRHDLYRF